MLQRLLFIIATSAVSTAFAAPKINPASAPEAKQAELQELRGQIKQLQKDLVANESNRSEAADALKNAESSISEANRVLNELANERQLTAAELARLNQDISNTRKNIQTSQKQLSELLKSRYKTGNTEAWRLLLNQKDPGQASRDLSYYRYIAQSQQALAKQLESQLSELNLLADAIREKNEELQEIARNKQRQRQELVSQQQEKKELVSQLSQTINSQRNQIQKLAADEKRITQLIDRLNAIIKQQEAARARAAAKQKQETEKRAAAQAKAERASRQAQLEQAAKTAGKPIPSAPPEPKENATASQSQGDVNNTVPDSSQAGVNFAALKGKMRLPAKGEIIGRFGTPRGEGGTWKGLFIRTNTGEPVHAVGSGRIVFADWLRGFGNLMIIDHGNGYMSLYGSNESLLKRVGDSVKAGDTIANAGNSGGMADSGVYFEIRQNSRPLDPAAWVR
ncbi:MULTISPECIES: murein hydrolase activator EnvC family protein [Deefgea]|uniref:Peptidoglycan DD-metalloendopeptidase family protein n=1 Tax=Deefgea chitinilytica TaxID=570276 RepID=A0ABS2CEI9_9NEIS|nr:MULTISPECIES: peptidoglycan DD-metalloendopeptidase family protein [Deefgea]MBM5572563.1 peptidoglycan DD-metalloendopeptidase family protein [Deefgea chitinilytica]MBM9889799.1 peptidoglycan DD-metalloendopeptidase family protein [Deefgea sp. CFH1-16]